MIFIYDYSGGWGLLQSEFLTGFVPQLMAVGLDKRCLDAVHHDTTLIRQYGQHLRHDFLQMASMTADEDGVRTGEGREVCLQEIADMDIDAWSTKNDERSLG